jgi:general secretion pathway protein A
MDIWGEKNAIKPYLNDLSDDEEFFRLAAKQNGFLLHSLPADLDLVRKLNLPAILQLYMPGDAAPFYLSICRLKEDQITLKRDPGDTGITFKTGDLTPFLGKKVLIPWKNFYDYRGIIPIRSTKDTGFIPLRSTEDTIITLKIHLRDMGFDELDTHPVYDEKTKKIITLIQKKYGIREDGLVGPLTKIILYNEIETLNIPKIRG